MARGFAGGHHKNFQLALSPRSHERTQRLAQLEGVSVCASAQEVLDSTDIVILALPRSSIVATSQSLNFSPGQVIISVAAGVKHARLQPQVEPATLLRAMPVTAAACQASPTCLYPHDQRAVALLSYLGPVHAFDVEAHFEAAAIVATYYGWLFALMGETSGWLAEQGVAPQTADALVAQMTGAAACTVTAQEADARTLAEEIAPPGSFTRAGRHQLDASGALDAWVRACQVVLQQTRTP